MDGRGRPTLLLRRTGAGSVVFRTCPVEHIAAVTPRVNPEATSARYDALAAHAGVRRPVTVEDPGRGGPAGARGRPDLRPAGQPGAGGADGQTVVADGVRLLSLEGAAADTVVPPPYGVRVLRLADAAR
ncbi:hypothetical protein [Streptomyces sp. MK37H]|uniref:hypothetical protein n=1 Tax=Streptomyces sp. MK37H TaxID=2699117 RepID=UPI001FF7D339|nr:hypothetical protein [Streptomyces sp. MK37H]